ncbi:MAG TPA: DNA polymerase III subunit alpha, partial [Rikenellaceae bacterium]|nr:DNA polymerase III subunit alpha [Rikenellaceae bacterium]
GYGRGSVTGSVIAYIMDITKMDSIKHKLNFERFMSSARVSLSDVDTDLPPSRREEIRKYLSEQKGLYTSDIITFNTIALKGAIRDIGRALSMPISEVNDIAKSVEVKETELRSEYPELFEYVDIVNGTITSVGIHPSACIVSPIPLDESVGTYTSKDTAYPISQIHMKEIDSLNFVKLDLLGLATAEIIDETCKFVGIDYLTPDTLDIDDEAVWNSMRQSTTGIFQWDKQSGSYYYKELFNEETIRKFKEQNPNFSYMDLFSIGNGALRPAGASYREPLSKGIMVDNGHEALNEFLSNTYSRMIFQEQIIEFLHKFCGYSKGDADLVRRHIAKKYTTEEDIPKIKAGFVKTMQELYGVPEYEANDLIIKFLKIIEDASDYGFSLNHSQAYSYMGYACAWLRYYYPVEFLTASLIVKQDKKEDTVALSQYAKEIGIAIENPKFGFSKGEYNYDAAKRVIYKGVGSIKGLNKTTGDQLYALSKTKDYTDFTELLVDIAERNIIGQSNLDTLASLNYFEKFGNNKKIMDFIKQFSEGKGIKYDKKHVEATKEKRKLVLKDIFTQIPDEKLSIIEQVKAEVEYLGYATSKYPDTDPKLNIVVDSETLSWATKVIVVNLADGEMHEYLMSKKAMVGVKKVYKYGVVRIEGEKIDKRGTRWIESYIMVM